MVMMMMMMTMTMMAMKKMKKIRKKEEKKKKTTTMRRRSLNLLNLINYMSAPCLDVHEPSSTGACPCASWVALSCKVKESGTCEVGVSSYPAGIGKIGKHETPWQILLLVVQVACKAFI